MVLLLVLFVVSFAGLVLGLWLGWLGANDPGDSFGGFCSWIAGYFFTLFGFSGCVAALKTMLEQL